MDLKDLIVTPIYLIILLMVAYALRGMVTDSLTRRFYMQALLAKVGGAVLIGLIYQYYYGWGDTFSYYYDARRIWKMFPDSPVDAMRLIFMPLEKNMDLFGVYTKFFYFRDPNSFMMVRIAGFIGLFTFNTYSATALVFAAFSFSGSWAFFRSLARLYPQQTKRLAWAVLFIPSVLIWGSGLLKDTITLGALLWLGWAFIKIIERRRLNLKVILVILTMILLIASIRTYILVSFFPVVVVWFFLKRMETVKNVVLKVLVLPIILGMVAVGGYLVLGFAGSLDARYSLDTVAQTAQITSYDIRYGSGKDAGSGYTLGELDGTWGSMIALAPAAVVVSLYRPFLWEVNNPLMLMSALESLLVVFLTIPLLIRPGRTIKILVSNPMMMAFFLFAIIFAFAVGISTYNFGTLVRYKIPMMPFLFVVLLLVPKLEAKKIS